MTIQDITNTNSPVMDRHMAAEPMGFTISEPWAISFDPPDREQIMVIWNWHHLPTVCLGHP